MFKKNMTPLRKGGQLVANKGKGATSEVLPSRSALATLTQGDPGQRTMNNYAKATPLASPLAETPSLSGA